MLLVKAARLLKDLTQTELAERAQMLNRDVNLIDNGRLIPRPDQAARLSKVLGVPVDQLLIHVDELRLGLPGDAEFKMTLRDEERPCGRR